MKYYMAPMEGVTGYQFRMIYHEYYGDADRYFTPFLVGKKLSAREKAEVAHENNPGMQLIPQILTNRADEFVYIANRLKEYYGYDEVNLNLGCPSGTVASKNRGSGFLRVLDELNEFLDYIYTHSETKISIKTRIGVLDSDTWEDILRMYLQYPMSELIVHPRTQRQGYGGFPDEEAFALAYEMLGYGTPGVAAQEMNRMRPVPLCYNGNIYSVADRNHILERFPNIPSMMCGRGLVQNPELIHRLKYTEDVDAQQNAPDVQQNALGVHYDIIEDVENFRAYTNAVYRFYRECGNYNEKNMLFRVKELWFYWSKNFPEPEKVLRSIQKTTGALEYEAAVNAAFRTLR